MGRPWLSLGTGSIWGLGDQEDGGGGHPACLGALVSQNREVTLGTALSLRRGSRGPHGMDTGAAVRGDDGDPEGIGRCLPAPSRSRASIAGTMAAQRDGDEKPFHIISPILESLPLSGAAGTKVYMKLENIQPTGSFKIRGIGRLCQEVSVGGVLLVGFFWGARGWGGHVALFLPSFPSAFQAAKKGCRRFVCSSGNRGPTYGGMLTGNMGSVYYLPEPRFPQGGTPAWRQRTRPKNWGCRSPSWSPVPPAPPRCANWRSWGRRWRSLAR